MIIEFSKRSSGWDRGWLLSCGEKGCTLLLFRIIVILHALVVNDLDSDEIFVFLLEFVVRTSGIVEE